MSGHQQTIYTIHESQLNNNNGGGPPGNASSACPGQRNGQNNNDNNNNSDSATDILIDTSSIPLSQQQPLPPIMQHQHLPLQAQQLNSGETITSQPIGAAASTSSGSARVAPESQNVVYSVHPVFSMLDNHDTLLIRQKADCTSTCCGFESTNTYTVRAKDGSPILKAIENSNCCERCCCEANREYNLSLVYGDETVARIRKPYRVSRFCCYTNAVRIESPEDNPIGHIRQLFTLFGHPRYAIYDCQQSAKTPTFSIESTSCRFCCTPLLCVCLCGIREFRIVSIETREQVGTISRRWQTGEPEDTAQQSEEAATIANGAETSAANNEEPFNSSAAPAGGLGSAFGGDQLFGIQMAPNLEARHKVLLLSACFMMDFFYFENDRRRRKLASC